MCVLLDRSIHELRPILAWRARKMDGPKKLIALDLLFCSKELAMQGLGPSLRFSALPLEIALPKLFGLLRYEFAGPEL
jgi:hypothetical protein